MTVGRKGSRAGESDDDDQGSNESSSPPAIPVKTEPALQEPSGHTLIGRQTLSTPVTGQSCTLPSFETFLRDTFHHRGLATSKSTTEADDMALDEEVERISTFSSSNRSLRSRSGTWLHMDDGATPTFGEHGSARPASEPLHHGSPDRSPYGRALALRGCKVDTDSSAQLDATGGLATKRGELSVQKLLRRA